DGEAARGLRARAAVAVECLAGEDLGRGGASRVGQGERDCVGAATQVCVGRGGRGRVGGGAVAEVPVVVGDRPVLHRRRGGVKGRRRADRRAVRREGGRRRLVGGDADSAPAGPGRYRRARRVRGDRDGG